MDENHTNAGVDENRTFYTYPARKWRWAALLADHLYDAACAHDLEADVHETAENCAEK